MNNLITNGDFATQALEPWESNSQQPPVFEPVKDTTGAYGLRIEPSTEIRQLIGQTDPTPFRLKWQFSARIDSRAHLGAAVAMLFTARSGQKYYLDISVTHELTDDWQTFSHTGITEFPADHEGLYVQIISARKAGETGPSSAPVHVTGISASYQ